MARISLGVAACFAFALITAGCGGRTTSAPGDAGTASSSLGGGSSSTATSSSGSGDSTSSSPGSGSSSGSLVPVDCATGLVGDASDFLNSRCDVCIVANCLAQWCQCFKGVDPELGTAAPACGVYVDCIYSKLIQASLSAWTDAGDAGSRDLNVDLMNAQAACQPGIDMSAIATGNTLVTCIAANQCDPICVGL